MNHTDFQAQINQLDQERQLQKHFPGKHCGAEDCETQCAEALKIARKLNLEPVPFVQNFIVDKIAPEYGCSKPAGCTAEILENMRCRFGFVRPETAARLVANAKEDENAEIGAITARRMAEAAVIAGETLYAEKKTESPDTMFLYFNGRYLYSSDGKFVATAVAGEGRVAKQKLVRHMKEKDLFEVTHIFDYSKRRQYKEEEGPLPEGLYSIKNNEYGSFWRWNWRKHWFYKKAWGNYHWSLIPDPETDMLNREPNSFTIHGGDELGSAGCIDLLHNENAFQKFITSMKNKETYVYVHFPNETISMIVYEIYEKR